jgi:parvulin-like peptidyl-prolyl isomerase
LERRPQTLKVGSCNDQILSGRQQLVEYTLHDNIPIVIHSTFIISITMSQVRAAHLLIKHTGSRNPVSRRTGAEVTMAPADAMAELKEYEARILQEGIDASFPKYAKERSDCSSFRQNGDLGHFGRGDMQKPFEDATFALQPGQMSGIVSTDSGYHLIYRIE